ncbi:cyclase family protein [Paenarthrobacter ureafaciens]|uniref:cyclase family protein n=1 Tax=Paenarthrobacter ureafaciens TaxID=37931 RepID=UPI001E80177B|nr:cyclase family protein [Paenarthrobacter ureafaciens]MEC3854187.1 cyclase family protein [Paenarthrobacter ureafaciens]BCW86416.1 cyclase [Arthrobacter sp. NicSoilE8]
MSERSFPQLGAELLTRSLDVVDLTRPIYEGMPQWFGHQKTFIMVNQTHEEFTQKWKTKCGFEAHNLLISEHVGTHTDAIFEYAPDGPKLHESPLAFYYGPAVCIDVEPWVESDIELLSKEKLLASVEASGQEIRRGDVLLLHFGYGDRVWPELAYAERNPGLSREATQWIAEQGVVNIGVDQMSIDSSEDAEFSAHVVCAEYGIVNTESLTNLSEIKNERVLYLGLPLNIRGGTGSPIRAIAIRQDV